MRSRSQVRNVQPPRRREWLGATAPYYSRKGRNRLNLGLVVSRVKLTAACRRLGGVGLPQLHRLAARAHPDVQHLDEDREPHREIDVALGDVLPQPVGDERDTD